MSSGTDAELDGHTIVPCCTGGHNLGWLNRALFDDQVCDDEVPLPGRATAGLVRIRDPVRRPVGPWTAAVDALPTHLHAVGFTGAPRPLGRDAQGRQVVEYVPGSLGDPNGTYP